MEKFAKGFFIISMDTLIFATNNQHKVEEVQSILDSKWHVLSLQQAGIFIDIPEPHQTLKENASEKSSTIYQITGKNCFSEDTGLAVDALQGAPGVHSARYAGDSRSFSDNISKLLFELKDQSDRRARFRTVISSQLNGKEDFVEGICEGNIIDHVKGAEGFGYDPVFVPEGDTRTFAEMSMAEKNTYSHRRKAMDKLIAFLDTIN